MPQPGHIQIAIATNDLLQANGHFASAKQLVIYDISADSAEFVDCVQFRRSATISGAATRGPGGGQGCSMSDPSNGASSELIQERLEAVRGCALLFSKGLSDLHAVNVKNLGAFPVKLEQAREIPEVILYVQRLISRPPLWLRRALGIEPPLEVTAASWL
ncbi:nitrogen fixation protein [Thiobaca trueperi]|uniref:Nitrogen fixation protein NifX n=1 Tax=Thiobaca trueperi TaxID=127458 RepID=A0A4R3N5F2_9GAMM|nr:nitrogen fixation protein [Thiobaca trueperi]TCT24265.1 nitrogen fixation protein NifX [Thiobaca trueperi]